MSYISQSVADYKDRFQTIKDYILMSLGYPVVRVEVTDDILAMAIMDAITRYYDRAAHDLNIEIVTVGANNIVTIPSTIKPSMIENVVFPSSVMDSWTRGMFVTGTEDIFGKYVIPQQSWTNILDNFDMVGYYLFLQRMEDFTKLVGIDRHWEIINGDIYLYPADATINEVGLLYKATKSDESLETTNWVKDWALAKTKYTLGIIRRKMSGFQTAGGNIAADGEALVSEAREEMAALKESLNLSQKPLPFIQI